MKNTTVPRLRVPQELRKQVKALLEEGETFSSFMMEALSRHIEYRKVRQKFLGRGLASAARSRKTGKYVAGDAAIAKLARRLARARLRQPIGA